jgi:predicted nucleotidyltransferase
VDAVVAVLSRERAVEGIYLSGSLVRMPDWFADVDLGVATKDSAAAFRQVWGLRERLAQVIGPPVRMLERGWAHTRMVALLYGKAQFPPIGLEVDLAVSQLRHVGEQMPHARYKIVLDRTGRLRRALARTPRRRPIQQIREALAERMTWFGFHVHDALKAYGRRDLFHFQFLLEQMRGALYHAAGERVGQPVYWSKWAIRYLAPAERKAVEASYREFTPQMVRRLARAYLSCLAVLAPRFGLEREVGELDRALAEIL